MLIFKIVQDVAYVVAEKNPEGGWYPLLWFANSFVQNSFLQVDVLSNLRASCYILLQKVSSHS